MIRTPSSNRVNITVTSYQEQYHGSSSTGGRPPRSGGGTASGSKGSRLDSLWVLLGLALFLALIGLFFLHRLQSSFEPGDEGEALPSFQQQTEHAASWAP
jgi:hypothetical protein